MKRNHRLYTKIGHVRFPVHSPEFHDLTHIKPEDSGVMTVRLLIEDTTNDQQYPVVDGPPNAPDDFLVGCDKFETAKEAHEYFAQPRKIVDNILLGAIDWCGVKRVDGAINVVDLFRATVDDLEEQARALYEELQYKRYPGCTILLITSLDRKTETVTLLMEEVDRTGLQVKPIPRVPHSQEKIRCKECADNAKLNEKPHLSAKRKGWVKIAKGHWSCPEHAALHALPKDNPQ